MEEYKMFSLGLVLVFVVGMGLIWLWDFSYILRSEENRNKFDDNILRIIMIFPPIMLLEFIDKTITNHVDRVVRAREKK